MTVTKNSRIVKVLSEVFTDKKKLELDTFKEDYKESLALIKELASNPNPMNLYELNEIVAYVVDNMVRFYTNYLDIVGDVQRTDLRERPIFKYRTQQVEAYWQTPNGTPDASRIGFSYGTLKYESLSAMPVAEWIEIADGRYDFQQLIEDVFNQFDIKIAQKVQDTLNAALNGLAEPTYGAGNGIVQATFDKLLNAMQRLGGCAIVGDYEALQKLPGLTAVAGKVSDGIIDEYNRSGIIGVYKGATVVKLVNPYVGLNGFETALNKGYIYIVPNVRPELKTLKIWFPGGVMSMQQQNINDRSYQMRFDQLMGAGVVGVNQIRQPIAIYEDTTLS
jgi:hypothetical protein